MLSTPIHNVLLNSARFEGIPPQRPRSFLNLHFGMLASLTLMSLMITGCGKSSPSGGNATPITVTNANGLTAPATALSIGSTLNLSMTPSNDVVSAGVDWAVSCLGNPTTGSFTNGACGTLAPTHTTGGGTTVFTAPSAIPIGNTVTITATVTSNPSQASTVSFTILPTPIALAFANELPPTSLQINMTAPLSARETNDPVNAGEIWTASCGSSECGSFNPITTDAAGNVRTTYTAPAVIPTGGTVTIRATSLTDTTKSISATLTITGPPPPPPPPAPISVSVLPANAYVQRTGASRSALLTAVVSNDPAAAGVDWTVSCSVSSCGSITSHTASGSSATFQNNSSAPVGGIITILARSTSDPTKTATAIVTVATNAPVGVSITAAPPARMNTGSQVTLAASASPGSDGMNWTATCGSVGACGTFNLSPAHTANNGPIIYTAPAAVPNGNIVTISASFAGTAPSNPAFATTTVVPAPPPTPTLSFSSAPPSALVSATQLPLSVVIANDSIPDGVIWTVQCSNTNPGGCGWFSPSQTASGATTTYTAPPVTTTGTTVVLTATSVSDPSVSLSSSSITINPDTTSVHFIPSLPSQVQVDTTVALNAAVANDPTHAGIDWQVCPSGCGFFTIKPAVPAILATATTPYVPAIPAVTATTVTAWPNGLSIPYTAPSQVPPTGVVSVVVSAHADSSKANSGTITIGTIAKGPELHGIVQAGTQPVVGASVALFAAGSNGYGSLSTQIASALTTDTSGNFKITEGYSCPQPGSQMYLVATGGKVGQNGANPNLALMTALGSCNSLSSSPVVLNEVTTVASAMAVAQFAADDALTGNASYLYIGSSSGNSNGLVNSFATVNNLVDISTGRARFTVPAENAAVPYVQINTMADLLNACTATGGGVKGDGSTCSTLFTATDLLGTGSYGTSITPKDTLQAAFNIAQHPVANYGYDLDGAGNLFGLASSASPFQPILLKRPNDWSISLNYTEGGGLSAGSSVGSFAVDAVGNLWITDIKNGSVIEWNTVGAALSPETGFPAGGGPIAIDATGNIWVSGDGVLTELTNLGTPLPWSPFGGVSGGGSDIAIDAQSNLWIPDGVGISAFNQFGMLLSPLNGYTFDGIPDVSAVGIDSSNNVWVGASGDSNAPGHIAELANPGGQLIIASTLTGPAVPQVAADRAGDIWFIDGEICEAKPYGGNGSILVPSCMQVGAPVGGSTPPALTLLKPAGIAIDGAGTVWVAGQGGTSNQGTVPAGVLPINPAGSPTNAIPYASSSLAAGTLRVAVDSSGNLWVLLANNTMTEYVGVAVPAVTPIARGIQNKKLATKP